MTTADDLAAIEARLTADENEYSDPGLYDQTIRDRRALLAIIREQAEKLAKVEALAAAWESRGEHDMAYSKTIPDEDIAIEILTDGAQKVENARHIRNALGAGA